VRGRPPELSEAHLQLVERELRRVLNALPAGCFDPDDGRSAGYEGLVEALGRFDPRYGVSFERYARQRVRGAIIDGLRALTPFGRAGYQQLKSLYRAHVARAHSSEATSVTSSDGGGLSAELEASFGELKALATSLCIEALELNQPQGDEVDDSDAIDQEQERARLSEAFNQLSTDDQTLIVAFYDLRQVGDGVRQLAQRLGVSPAAVSQRHRRAMRRLRGLVFDQEPGSSR